MTAAMTRKAEGTNESDKDKHKLPKEILDHVLDAADTAGWGF